MIDLNDVWKPPVHFDLRDIRRRLEASASDWLPGLFPNARMAADRKSLRCADLSGRAPRGEGSCVIHLKGPYAGTGYDHATGEFAGSIDLIHHATGLSDRGLFAEAARLARLELASPQRLSAAPSRPDHSLEVERILGTCEPLAGTLAETYLKSRGLENPRTPDLLFNADLTDFETARGWVGMVAIVRDGRGEPTGGIHRTFLLDDGSAKAPPGKKMLGPVAGGSVRLGAMTADGCLGIAEGIETALAASRMFGIPVWAGLSADGLRRWQWPEGVMHVTIFADAGDAGRQAAATLGDRLNVAGISNRIVFPLHGDDFNDDVLRGAVAGDYEMSSAVPAEAPVSEQLELASAVSPVDDLDALIAAAEVLTNPPDLKALGSLLGRLALARLEPLLERQVVARIKTATGIATSILEKQLAELRRRVSVNGDPSAPIARPRWYGRLRMDLAGAPERHEANVIIALASDEAFAGAIIYNEFRQEICVTRPMPWDGKADPCPRPWCDIDDIRLAEWAQLRGLNVAPVIVSRGVSAIARECTVHPVRDYLSSVKWDGTPRLDNWVCRHLGAEDTEFCRMAGALWMISAVARIFTPGAKADHMLILEGPQGTRKSTALKVLAGEEWFTDELPELGSKDAALHMQGVWIIEIAELDAIGRAEVSRIKAFLTRTTDRFRPPYGRYSIDVPRQCVFAGTANPDTYLRDETGNRRFWPIRCNAINIDTLRLERDQLWAEAVHRFRAGAIWWIDNPAMLTEAKSAQDARYQADAWDARIDRWLTHDMRRVNRGFAGIDDWKNEEIERAEPVTDVSVGEILEGALGIEPAKWTKIDQMRVGAWLKSRQWERYRARSGESREWRYRKTGMPD